LKVNSVRKSLPVIAALAAVLLLAGCTAASTVDQDKKNGCAGTVSGSQSDSVKVTGKFQAKPTVKITSPLKATKVERTVTITGKGKESVEGSTVDIGLAAYNGTTGKVITNNGFDGETTQPVSVDETQIIPGIVRAIECLPVGSRSVTTLPVKTAFGSADPTQLGLKTTDSIVFVADVVKILPSRAKGTQQPPVAGMPTVKLAKDGKPTVTMPKTAPPAKTTIAVLQKGSGEVVKANDTVSMQYQGSIWSTGKVFDQSWGKSAISQATSGFIPGFSKALVGQTVGSQVLVSIAPADGYGTKGNSGAGIKGTDTIVFVIDILQTAR
jgi:peptidylprolyl isomerase